MSNAVQARDNLRKIEHIVVLVLENRSFDHMLGYLSLPLAKKGRGRLDVDGLTGNEFNLAPGYLTGAAGGAAGTIDDPRARRVFRLSDTSFPADPRHGASSVRDQIGGIAGIAPMGGFVRSFAAELASETEPSGLEAGDIMGYYTGDQVPSYDFLAQNFAVCDRWFSSMPGPTWPNRMFLYCGTSNGIVSNPGSIANYPPEYDKMPERLIVDVLDEHKVTWRIFSHDFAWMRFFRSFDPGPIPGLSSRVDKFSRFLARCADGELPAVSFIDPNWVDIGSDGATSDDHPPADIGGAQRLVRTIYEALRTGRDNLFRKTLFIVSYDEHGGFYDHVSPPPAPDFTAGMSASLATYGVRVPALVASPWIPPRAVSHTLLDNTSILKTILLRFCNTAAINSMGKRVRYANHLGELLSLPQARNVPAMPARAARAAVAAGSARPAARPHDLAVAIAQARARDLTRGVPLEHL